VQEFLSRGSASWRNFMTCGFFGMPEQAAEKLDSALAFEWRRLLGGAAVHRCDKVWFEARL
jgi:hypothetical protein